MNYNVFFSPTGGTKKVVQYIGKQIGDGKNVDISLDFASCVMKKSDFCAVGVPSFSGRVPSVAAERLKKLRGSQTPALLVVTYGSRAYEDTLTELKDVLEAQGFVCIGAAAIVTEHSIVHQFGAGRPTAEDYAGIDAFIGEIKARLQKEHLSVAVPGNRPYKQTRPASMQIQATEQCVKCGLCAKSCPVNAIPAENPSATDCEACISCMRCVSICPVGARKCDAAKEQAIAEKLAKVCLANRPNEFF